MDVSKVMEKDRINQIIEDIKQRIVKQIKPEFIMVFGSIAKGNATSDSDLDIFIVWNENREYTKVKRRSMLRKIIGFTEVPIDIITCTTEELKRALEDERSFASQIVKEGELIYGRLG